MSESVKALQAQLKSVELRFEPLRAGRQQDSAAWQEVAARAAAIRRQLWALTGDAYGKSKQPKAQQPDEALLCARYESPDEVPAEVMAWVRRHANILTSDATDAVRWSRIVQTEHDERYPPGGLTLYRAVGRGGEIVPEIRPGDWVSTSRDYAQMHLERYLGGKGQILQEDVDGCDVLASPTGNPEEAIFAPMHLSGPLDKGDDAVPAPANCA